MLTPCREAWAVIGLLLLAGCGTEEAANCFLIQSPPDFSREREFADDPALTFRFPMDGLADRSDPVSCTFSTRRGPSRGRMYHAAEDYPGPPGTPVFAMADGEVTFSGRMGGYGWLIIVDHPKSNLYSLYGHLSPSRWRSEEGEVRKGDLLAYLGDPHENGGSKKKPLHPHLHFGIRAGQRTDYPGKGEWRWQAGWIDPKPTDVGWLRPSEIINGQRIPEGGFVKPDGKLLEVWGVELALVGAYLVGGTCMVITARRRRKPLLLIVAAAACVIVGWLMESRGLQLAFTLYILATVLAALGLWNRLRVKGAGQAGLAR